MAKEIDEKGLRELKLYKNTIIKRKTAMVELQEMILDTVEEDKIYQEMEFLDCVTFDCDSCIEEVDEFK